MMYEWIMTGIAGGIVGFPVGYYVQSYRTAVGIRTERHNIQLDKERANSMLNMEKEKLDFERSKLDKLRAELDSWQHKIYSERAILAKQLKKEQEIEAENQEIEEEKAQAKAFEAEQASAMNDAIKILQEEKFDMKKLIPLGLKHPSIVGQYINKFKEMM